MSVTAPENPLSAAPPARQEELDPSRPGAEALAREKPTASPATPDVASAPSRLQVACVVAAGLFFAIERVRILIAIGVERTTEDQTIFWWVARDFMHLVFPEPLFYGSPYSSHLESLLAVPLIAVGVRPHIAIPLVTSLLTSAPWVLLAVIAWRRGFYNAAIAALCSQLVLPVEYAALSTQAAQGTGSAVAGIGAALLFGTGRPDLRYAALCFFLALGFCLHPNSIFLVGPTAAYAVLMHYRDRRFWLWGVPAAAVVGALDLLALRFYATHPSFVLHNQWPVEFQWAMFVEGLDHLDRHLGDLTPTQFHAAGFLALGSTVVVWLATTTKNVRLLLTSGVLLVGVLASLSITKLHNGSDSYIFPYSRGFHSYPQAIWWLLVMWASVVPAPNGAAARRAGAVAAAAILVLGIWRQSTLTSEIARVIAVPSPVVSTTTTAQVLEDCRRLRKLANAHDVDLVLHSYSRLKAYACGALWYGKLDTLYPPYDRRTLAMFAERDRVRSRILIAEPSKGICRLAAQRGFKCKLIGDDPRVALISSPGVSALTVAQQLGIGVRHL